MRSPCESGSLAGRNGSASKVLPAPLARRVAGAQQREVVEDVELQDDERRLAAVGGDVDEVVAVGLERRFADDVEVGDDVALRRDEEARADRGLAGAALQDGADLDQLRARLLVDLARRERHRRGGHGRRRRADRPPRRPDRRSAPSASCAREDDAASASTPKAAQRPTRTLIREDSTGRHRCRLGANVAATVVRPPPRGRKNQTGDTASCNDAA